MAKGAAPAFDPDAFLSEARAPAAAKSEGFDPDAFLAESAAAPAPKQKPVMNAGLQGATQGMFGGFMDEIGGAVRGLAENHDIRNIGRDYRRERDAIRSDNKTAEAYDPTAYRAGQIGGGLASAFVPGINVAKGVGLGGKLASAAKVGGLYGLGESDADLTKGDVTGAAADTLKGAATGAATAGVLHGAGKVVGKIGSAIGRGAAARVEEREIADALKGVSKPAQEKAYAKLGNRDLEAGKGEFTKILKSDPELANALRKEPGAATEIINARKADIGKQIGEVYKAVDAANPGLPKAKVLDALDSMVTAQKKAGNTPGIKALKTEIKELGELWADQDLVPAETLHNIASRYGEGSYSGAWNNISASKRLGREMTSKVRSVLENHVKDVSGEEAAASLKTLNKSYSQTKTLEDIAKARARASATGSGKTFVDKIADTAAASAGGAGILGSIATGNLAPLATAGGIVATLKGGRIAMRGADLAIAKLYNAAKNGGAVEDAFRYALENGVPRATAEGIVRTFGAGRQ